jgi:hypothetical protein
MNIKWNRLSRRETNGLLDGTATRNDALGEVLRASSAPAREGELAREGAAVAMFHSAHLDPVVASRREPMLSSTAGRSAALKAVIASIAAVTIASGGIALAASGNLPGTHGPARADESITDSPSDDPTEPTETETDDPGSDGTEPTESPTDTPTVTDAPSATPSPSLKGLCRAFSSGNKTEKGKALESPAFAALISAAGGIDGVEEYCLTLLGAPAEHPTHPAHPTPTHPTNPASTDHPSHPAAPSHPASPSHPSKPSKPAHS